jgi:hypothetical protein
MADNSSRVVNRRTTFYKFDNYFLEINMRAEDVLPEEVNQTVMSGITIRKGSVGAFLANAKILTDSNTSIDDRALAEKDLISLIPALRALGLFEVLEIKDEKLRRFVEMY